MGNDVSSFAAQVKTMRDLQKQYFMDREAVVLHMAKVYEKIVDAECEKILSGQRNLL